MALELARAGDMTETRHAWALQRALVEGARRALARARQRAVGDPRAEPRHFTHSRLMVWVAFDGRDHGRRGPRPRRAGRRVAAHPRRGARARSSRRGSTRSAARFVQHYDTTEVDAALLLIPVVGFLPGDDPRVLGTIEADRGGPDARRPAAALSHPVGRRRDRAATSTRSSRARSGWSRRRRGRVGSTTPSPDGSAARPDQRRRAAVGGVRPARTSAWSATSRRRSRTWRWSAPRSPSAASRLPHDPGREGR